MSASSGAYSRPIAFTSLGDRSRTSSRSSLIDARCVSMRCCSSQMPSNPRGTTSKSSHAMVFSDFISSSAAKTPRPPRSERSCNKPTYTRYFAGPKLREPPAVCSHGHHIEILKIRKQIGEPFREGGHCRAHYLDRQVPQLLNVQTHNVQTNGKQDCQQRRGKAGKQQRQCDDQCQLQQYEIHRHQH